METKTATLTAGRRGPVLLQDNNFLEDMAHFDRERIPERVVHAKGGGAFGIFETTHNVTKYTRLSPFAKIGKQTDVLIRFSTVGKLLFLFSLNLSLLCFCNLFSLSFKFQLNKKAEKFNKK